MAQGLKQFKWKNIKHLLTEHYSAPLNKSFRQFRAGAIFFAVGLIIIYLATTVLTPSAKQELIVLAGLLIASAGFITAMLAHIRMVISRIIRFFSKQ